MEQRVAFITGASSGLGYELARQLGKRGYALGLLARRRDRLEALAQEISRSGGKVAIHEGDVVDWEGVQAAIGGTEKAFGPIDLLIANAGVGIEMPVQRFDVAQARSIYEVNVIGLMQTIAAVLPSMLERKSGHVVGISSLASYLSVPRSYVYCASKAAVTAHLEGLRMELHSYGIKVSTVFPGFVKTEMTAKNRFKMPFLWDVEQAVHYTLKRLDAGDELIHFPWQTHALTRFAALLPKPLLRQIVSAPPKK